jgi:hypothetical protein
MGSYSIYYDSIYYNSPGTPAAPDVPGGGAQLVARPDAASGVREGQKADLWVDTAKAHLFDPETGAALTG